MKSSGSPVDETRSRGKRLGYAVAASGLSKALAVGVQFLGLPFALASLGTDRYAAFLALQASLGWTGLVGLGLVPALPYFISGARKGSNGAEQSDIVASAALYMIAAGTGLFAALYLLSVTVPIDAIVAAAPSISPAELTFAFRIVGGFAALQVTGGIMAAIRSGYHELHYTYAFSALANIAIIAELILLPAGRLSIWLVFIVLYGPMILSTFLDAAFLVWQRPSLLRSKPDIVGVLSMIAPHAGSALGAQLSFFMLAYLPLVIVSHLTDAGTTAAYGSIMLALITLGSALNLVILPLVPAIADARSAGDIGWLKRAYLGSLTIVLGSCILTAIVLATLGPAVFRVWLGRDLGLTPVLCAQSGLYFIVWMSSIYHFNVLSGMGLLDKAGVLYVFEAVFAIVLGTVLTTVLGASGMVAGLTIAILCVSGWYMPMRIWGALGISLRSRRGGVWPAGNFWATHWSDETSWTSGQPHCDGAVMTEKKRADQ